MKVVSGLNLIAAQMRASQLSAETKLDLLTRIAEKQQQAEAALNLALGVTLTANVNSNDGRVKEVPKEADALTAVSPGQEFVIGMTFHNGSKLPLTIDQIKLDVPAGWSTINGKTKPETVQPGKDLHADFRLRVPKDTPYTRPYWHRDDPNTEAINHIDNEKYATLPFPPPALRARIEYAVKSGTANRNPKWHHRPCSHALSRRRRQRALANSGDRPRFFRNARTRDAGIFHAQWKRLHRHRGRSRQSASCDERHFAARASAGLALRTGSDLINLQHRGEKQDSHFKVFPAALQPGRATIRAIFDSDGEKYSEGYTLVAREDLGSFYYYQPARQRVSIVDVKVPHDLKIGYIMGAGDDIPTILKQLGMDVTLIPADQLSGADLSKFGTIVLGIRAYDTQKDVVTNNKKLLDFASAGGTLVVQYNTSVGDFNSDKLTPYPADLSRARVSVEEAPVDILAPQDSIFHYPNTITEADFNDWVQERGLYFMSKWDDHYTPLLACHDPGEDPQKGGLLRAQYGKGTYIYAAYAFFRQLPAGVPGAVRLYVNILSAGHEKP